MYRGRYTGRYMKIKIMAKVVASETRKRVIGKCLQVQEARTLDLETAIRLRGSSRFSLLH